MLELPQQPQSIGKVLDTGFAIARHSYKRILPLSILYALLTQLPALMMPSAPGVAAGNDPASLGTGILIAVIISLFGGIIVYSAIIYRVDRIVHSDGASTGAALRVGLRKLLPLIGFGMLYMLAVSLGFVLLVIPGLILMVTLMFALPLIVVEDRGVFESFGQSHKLVWGNWWRTVGEFTVLMLIYLVPMILAAFIGGFASALSGSMTMNHGISALFNMAIVAALTPVLASGYMGIFYDRRRRREGDDLESRLSAEA